MKNSNEDITRLYTNQKQDIVIKTSINTHNKVSIINKLFILLKLKLKFLIKKFK